MKGRFVVCVLSIGVILLTGHVPVFSQETASNEFTLEEITVTAEKRAVNLQTVAISVVALKGSDLQELGRVTTAQILESVPNVTYRGTRADNLNGNITIRGVQTTQETGGGNAPSATAVYVDGIYQGIGGEYDINRVEVLRGPQGTLYGRSATGGVVAFHTNDPKLDKFSTDISGEYGTASLKNVQAAVNVPVSQTFALRVAAHYYDHDGYFNGEGGYTQSKEGRIKALYQPTDKLNILGSLSYMRKQSKSGGYSATLTAPDTIDYKGLQSDIFEGSPQKYWQASLNVNYDLEGSTLTYIGGVHNTDVSGHLGVLVMGPTTQTGSDDNPIDRTHTEEIRWASDSKGPLTWFIGSNYYNHKYDDLHTAIQLDVPGGNADTYGALITTNRTVFDVTNYGIFTEETYAVRNDLRVTGGLRYDKNKIVNNTYLDFNMNLNENGDSLKPSDIVSFQRLNDKHNFSNITYKARIEYDLTPENMLYALTATGFLPGDAQVSPNVIWDHAPGSKPTGVNFIVLPFNQERLTSYEVGTKNTLFDKKLQLNGSVFYYNYQGYQEAVNVGIGPVPDFKVIAVPVKMMGAEMDGQWLISMADKVSLTAGWLDAQIKNYPVLAIGDTKTFLELKRVPGIPKMTATLGYDHSFSFNNGSMLAAHGELRYASGYYLGQLTQSQLPYLEFMHQDSVVLGNVSATWTSSESKYSLTGYVRNVTDKEYKSGVSIGRQGPPGTPPPTVNVTPGDPRTFGAMLRVKF